MINTIIGLFVNRLADRLADAVTLIIRKRLKYEEIDGEAKTLKEELRNAQSNAEKEAVLEKVHDLINSLGK